MLEELQSLSEINKKRVLVISTIIIMIIIIGIWFSYFNSIMGGAAQQVAIQQTASQATSSAPTSPAPVVAAPVAVPAQTNGPSLWQDIKNGFSSFANIFRKPSQYDIKPQGN
jgi:hypothetical protein